MPFRLRRQGREPRVYPYDTPPRKGDYGLTAGSGLPMLVTRLGTFSRYGHACVALEDPHDDPNTTIDGRPRQLIKVIEAGPRGAKIRNRSLDRFRWSNLVIPEDVRDRIADRARRCEGIPYDWAAILGFVAKVWGYKLRLIGAKDEPDDKLICSELVVWAYRPDIDLAPGLPAGGVSPGDLGDYLVSH